MQTTVGIRDLKARLSHYVRQVKSGETVIITERGKPVGRIVPIEKSLDEKMQELVDSGFMTWSGKKIKSSKPVARTKGDKTAAQLLLEDRE